MLVTVRFYGIPGNYPEQTVEVAENTTPQTIFRRLVGKDAPPHVLVFVGGKKAEWGDPLHEGDEVAFISPSAGGT
ncbi:MAG: MoaD/ThiS family protein [Bacillota bacterium]